MLNINFSPFPLVTTENLVLRQMNIGDADEMYFLRSDKDVLKYIDRLPAKSVEEAVQFIEMIDANLANNEGVNWAIALKDSPTLIGNICYWQLQKENCRAEIGYVLHPKYWQKGIMDEAMKAVIDYAFNVMGLHSIEANTNPENKASQNTLMRNGFVQEAYFRENYYHAGKFTDSAIFSLVKTI
jgi:ribosomal-protein-alanine N-acetyltransferase